MLLGLSEAKLDNINARANKEKKEFLKALAQDLDRMIPTEIVSTAIVTQLHGRVSERFLRECLDEKYWPSGDNGYV